MSHFRVLLLVWNAAPTAPACLHGPLVFPRPWAFSLPVTCFAASGPLCTCFAYVNDLCHSPAVNSSRARLVSSHCRISMGCAYRCSGNGGHLNGKHPCLVSVMLETVWSQQPGGEVVWEPRLPLFSGPVFHGAAGDFFSPQSGLEAKINPWGLLSGLPRDWYKEYDTSRRKPHKFPFLSYFGGLW